MSSKDQRGQLERRWPVGNYGQLLAQEDPKWNAKHSARLRQLKWAYVPEKMKAYYSAYQKKNRERVKKSQKACIERKLEREKEPETEPDRRDPAVGYEAGARHLRLPCGEDCGNCPLPEGPEGCPYTDEDEDKMMEIEYGKSKKEEVKMGTAAQVQTTSGMVDFGAGICPEGFEIRSMVMEEALAEQVRSAYLARTEAEQALKAAIVAAGGTGGSYRIIHGTDTVQFLARTAAEG